MNYSDEVKPPRGADDGCLADKKKAKKKKTQRRVYYLRERDQEQSIKSEFSRLTAELGEKKLVSLLLIT